MEEDTFIPKEVEEEVPAPKADEGPREVVPGVPSEILEMGVLEEWTLSDLRELARKMGVSGYSRLKKEDLILRILQAKAEREGLTFRGGVLEILHDEGVGFLRGPNYLPSPEDVYVSQSQIRRFGLRNGDLVIGQVRPPKETERWYSLLRVETVNGMDPEQAKLRPPL
jgi:transcription termination factor Rho